MVAHIEVFPKVHKGGYLISMPPFLITSMLTEPRCLRGPHQSRLLPVCFLCTESILANVWLQTEVHDLEGFIRWKDQWERQLLDTVKIKQCVPLLLLLSFAEGHKFSAQVPLYQIPITAWVIQEGSWWWCWGTVGLSLAKARRPSDLAWAVTHLPHRGSEGHTEWVLVIEQWYGLYTVHIPVNSKQIPARSQANTERTIMLLHVLGLWLFLVSQETDSDRILDSANHG